MITMKAVVRNGRIETDLPLNLPDGTEFTIELPDSADVEPGWDTSPEGIAAWIARTDALPSLNMTARESAEAEAWLKECDRIAVEKLNREVDEMFP